MNVPLLAYLDSFVSKTGKKEMLMYKDGQKEKRPQEQRREENKYVPLQEVDLRHAAVPYQPDVSSSAVGFFLRSVPKLVRQRDLPLDPHEKEFFEPTSLISPPTVTEPLWQRIHFQTLQEPISSYAGVLPVSMPLTFGFRLLTPPTRPSATLPVHPAHPVLQPFQPGLLSLHPHHLPYAL